MKKKYLITGIAGSGKSTISKQLRSMGYEVFDLEEIKGMFAMYRKGTTELFIDFDNSDPEKIKEAAWLCDIEKLKTLLTTQKEAVAFYSAIASNIDDMIPLFDQVFVLSVPKEILHTRLSTREGIDQIGNTEGGRQEILGWYDWWEDKMKNKGATFISASGTPEEVVQILLKSI